MFPSSHIKPTQPRKRARAHIVLARIVATAGCLGTFATACRDDGGARPDASRAIRMDMQRFRVELLPDDHALGGDAPLVTIVVFSDYACPPCAKTWQIMQNLIEDYKQDLRVVFRASTVAGFAQGEQAVEAAFAAGAQGKFWDMHERLFSAGGGFDRPTLRAHAELLGLDVDRFMDDIDTGAHAAVRIRHRRQSETLALPGIPAAFINGLFVIGAHEESEWHAILDEEIRRCRQLLDQGTARADVYQTIMAKASTGRVGEVPELTALSRQAKSAMQAANRPVSLREPDGTKRYRVLPEDAPSLGPSDAPVVIVEFLDFECPFCRQTWKDSLQAVRDKYPKDVRLIVRHYPLKEIHESAELAAKAAIAAHAQGKFWPMHDKLLEHRGAFGRSSLMEIARRLGLDMDRFVDDLEAERTHETLRRDLDFARRLGVGATPTYFVNGRYTSGAQPLATFVGMIDEELAQAKRMSSKGVARGELFSTLMASAIPEHEFPNAHQPDSGSTAEPVIQQQPGVPGKQEEHTP